MTTKKPKTSLTSQSPRIMDIAKPGILKNATATSRPVIVTNRVVVQDPMVNPAGDKATQPAGADEGIQPERIVIKPLSDPETDDKDAAKEEIKAANKEGLLDIPFDKDTDGVVEAGEPRPTLSDPVKPPAPQDKPAEPAAPQEAASVSATKPGDGAYQGKDQDEDDADSADSEPLSDKADLDKVTAEEEAAVKAQEEFEEILTEKTYFLPINAAQHRRSRIVVIFGILLILVLALAWINIALDAGIITIPGVTSLTHFFGN